MNGQNPGAMDGKVAGELNGYAKPFGLVKLLFSIILKFIRKVSLDCCFMVYRGTYSLSKES